VITSLGIADFGSDYYVQKTQLLPRSMFHSTQRFMLENSSSQVA
jgi:hypothetical protein